MTGKSNELPELQRRVKAAADDDDKEIKIAVLIAKNKKQQKKKLFNWKLMSLWLIFYCKAKKKKKNENRKKIQGPCKCIFCQDLPDLTL